MARSFENEGSKKSEWAVYSAIGDKMIREKQGSSTDGKSFWSNKRVIVTGGNGFLGSMVVEKLRQRKAAQIFVPAIEKYDLTESQAIQRLFDDNGLAQVAQPHTPENEVAMQTVIIHLAALVGGIEANRARPAEFFYHNLMMGVQLMHEAWQRGVEKFVAIGTICAYPKFTPVPFKEENLWDGYRGDTLWAKKMLVQAQDTGAIRLQFNFVTGQFVWPTHNFNLTTSHVIPAMIRKFIEAGKGDDQATYGGKLTRVSFVDDAAGNLPPPNTMMAANQLTSDQARRSASRIWLKWSPG
jgi:GDP-L-fucose synthase